MSGLRKLVTAGVTLLIATPAWSADDLHQMFAGCVGRFSAEMEHAWLLGQAGADELAGRRETFLSLMNATITSEPAHQVLAYRIDSKMAHASLLALATFGQDAKLREEAKSTAHAHRLSCERILLDS